MIDDLFHFIKERYAIKLRREVGQPPPWTDDPILQKYRFCNVHREDDKVTQWIANNWRKPNQYDPNVWFAMVVARLVNWPPTMAEIGYPVPWRPSRFVYVIGNIQASKQKAYSGAYMIRADRTEGSNKAEYLARDVLTPLWTVKEIFHRNCYKTLREFHAQLMEFRDMGSFIAGQVVADLKYVPCWMNAPDWASFAAEGPGSVRGLNRVLGRSVKTTWMDNEWYTELCKLQFAIAPMVKAVHIPPLHNMDLQNNLCEFDKYMRTKLGEGRPRQYFRPDSGFNLTDSTVQRKMV